MGTGLFSNEDNNQYSSVMENRHRYGSTYGHGSSTGTGAKAGYSKDQNSISEISLDEKIAQYHKNPIYEYLILGIIVLIAILAFVMYFRKFRAVKMRERSASSAFMGNQRHNISIQ